MTARRRLRAVAALAALLVSWTIGAGAAFCVPEDAPPAGARHAAHADGGRHGMPHAPAPPAGDPAPADTPGCPVMAMTGGACLLAAASAEPADADPARPRAEYPHPESVRDRLASAAHFRPPKA